MVGPRVGQAFLRMRVDKPSFPGVLFLSLATALYTSCSVTGGKDREESLVGFVLGFMSSAQETFCKSARTR